MKEILLRLVFAMVNSDVIYSIVRLAIVALKSAIKSSSTDWDDKTILPIIEKLEKTLGT